MNNSKDFTENVEISVDLKALAYKLLAQWKMILLVSLLSGLVVMLLLYQRDITDYDSLSPSAEKQNNTNHSYNALELQLNENSREALLFLEDGDRAVVENLIREYQVCTSHEKAYYNSVYMNLDPTRERRLVMEYAVNSNDSEDFAKGALIQGYALSLKNEAFIKALGEALNASSEDQYLSQLVFPTINDLKEIAGGDHGRMEINVLLLEDSDAEAVKKVVTDHISNQNQQLGKKHAHTMELIESGEVWIVDEDLNYKQNDINNRIIALKKNLGTDKNSLTQKQLQVYEYVIGSEEGTVEAGTKGLAQSLESINGVEPPRLKASNFVGGMLLGLIAYICVFLIQVLCTGKVYSQKIAENLLRTHTLGNIYLPSRKRLFEKLFSSKIVSKLLGRECTLDIGALKEKVITACKLNNTNHIVLLEINKIEEERHLLEQLSRELSENISVDVKCLCDCSDSEMLESPPIVVSVCGEVTCSKDLRDLLFKVRYFNIPVIGLIYSSFEK